MTSDDRHGRTHEKQEFLSAWTMSHPLATFADARQVLRDKFGETLNTGFINTALKAARATASMRALGSDQPTGSSSPPIAGVRLPEIVAELKAAGITRIEIRGDAFDVSFAVNPATSQ